MPSVSKLVVLLVTFLAVLLSQSTCCFITNCLRGGKRSMDMNSQGVRACMRCGPEKKGQCVGPSICCGPGIGCFIGSEETEVCSKENDSTVPCYVEGKTCGAREQGTCVAEDICCDAGACSINKNCATTEKQSKVINLLQRILQEKEFS